MCSFKSYSSIVLCVAIGATSLSCSQSDRTPGSNDTGYEAPYGLRDAEYVTFLEADGESRIVAIRGSAKVGYQFLLLTEGQEQFKLVRVVYPALKYGTAGMDKTGAQQVGLCGSIVGGEVHIPVVDASSRLLVIYREYSQIRGKVDTGKWMVGYPDVHADELNFGDLLGAVPLDALPELSQFLSKRPYWLEIKNR